jgi:hypothetical protein
MILPDGMSASMNSPRIMSKKPHADAASMNGEDKLPIPNQHPILRLA